MNTSMLMLAGAGLMIALCGCFRERTSGHGFHMPAGDAARGKAAFVALGCTGCHRVEGVELPAPERRGPVMIALGGEVARVRTYGELVTAIIHPARDTALLRSRIPVAESGLAMRDFSSEMTVRELMDVVTFLEPTYRQKPAEYAMHVP